MSLYILLSGIALLPGCNQKVAVDVNRFSFLQVEVTSGEMGAEGKPLPFTSEPVPIGLRMQALNRDADPISVDARVSLDAVPGQIDGNDYIDVTGGFWEGTVANKNGFGPTRIQITDNVTKDESREQTYAVGVTEPFYYELPTIRQIQSTTDHETNQIEQEFARILTEGRQVAVTAVSTDGFWASDLMDPPGDFNGLYVYSFSRPTYTSGDEGDSTIDVAPPTVEVGDHLTLLTGLDQEYLATTQLSFPTFECDDEQFKVPDAIEVTSVTACGSDDLGMEALEAQLVRVNKPRVPDSFIEGSKDWLDYQDYGQWPIQVSEKCTIYADSSAVLDFSPTDYVGVDLPYLQGMLSEVWGKWIIIARDSNDIGGFTLPTKRPSAHGTAHRPLPRPRPASLSR